MERFCNALDVRVEGEERNVNQTSWVRVPLNSEPNRGWRDYAGKSGAMGF